MQTVQWENWRFPAGQRPQGKKTTGAGETAKVGPAEIGEQAAAVLTHATRIELARTLETLVEREEATRRYGAHDWTALGLGEVLAAGPQMLEKLSGGRSLHPHGCAIAEAAAVWQHAGAGRPITRAELRGLSALYLPEWASQTEDFESGLTWVTAPIKPGSEIRILSPRFRDQGEEPHFEIHDYIASRGIN